jgi:hypothetical protein
VNSFLKRPEFVLKRPEFVFELTWVRLERDGLQPIRKWQQIERGFSRCETSGLAWDVGKGTSSQVAENPHSGTFLKGCGFSAPSSAVTSARL